jgi:hypothetical protein
VPLESKTYRQTFSKSNADEMVYQNRRFGNEHENEPRFLQFSSIAESCRRDIAPGIEGYLAFNVTSIGKYTYLSEECLYLYIILSGWYRFYQFDRNRVHVSPVNSHGLKIG